LGNSLAEQVRAAAKAGQETELYFIFAGHGDVAQGEGFIEMADGRFTSSELKAWLKAIPFTRAHVILDSCNSFFMLGVRKPGGRHFATSEDAAQALATRLPNVGVFLSTSAEGEAFEWSEIQSGIFSHVVRSGLLGAADANRDGSVSYLELAAFVDTATVAVRNPNMRPHVYARGPGAADNTAIANVQSMVGVRRFELADPRTLRIRLRDATGLPLLDAHAERDTTLAVALPESWAEGATLERTPDATEPPANAGPRRYYTLPNVPGKITLAALESSNPTSAVRGPDETFHTLFSQPFGPQALASYINSRNAAPPPVYGVSKDDIRRMDLVLTEFSNVERRKRIREGIGAAGFGALMGGAGVGMLHMAAEGSASNKKESRIIGGTLLGIGSLMLIGGTCSLFAPNPLEHTASDFRLAIASGADPSQAFAAADKQLQEMLDRRRHERLGGIIVGSVFMAGTATGFIFNELGSAEPGPRMNRRLAWGFGFFGGGMMLVESLLQDTPSEVLAKIWRDDPSRNQYQQPSVSLSADPSGVTLLGTF
jgi:hypothetical protein